MNYEELLTKTRSYRRFYEDKPVTHEQLAALVRYASLTPSGGNKMPLKYLASTNRDTNDIIFAHVSWAAYLPDWNGPENGERPTGYLVMVRDTSIAQNTATDEGIQAMAIMTGATALGLGGCIMGNVQRAALAMALALDARYEIALVLALGYPKETVIMEPMQADGSVHYWHDADGVHHVPKRSATELLLQTL